MMQKRQFMYGIATVVVLTCAFSVAPAGARLDDDVYENIVQQEVNKSSEISEMNSVIEDKAGEMRDLEERRDVYQRNIEKKQEEILTLSSQVSLLEDKIEQTRIDIERAEIELDVLQMEIQVLKDQINIAEADIQREKSLIVQLIKDIHSFDQKTNLEIAFSNGTLSDVFSDLEYTTSVQQGMQESLDKVQHLKQGLEDQRAEVRDKKAEIAVQKRNLEIDEKNLEGEETYKSQLLEETQSSEQKFQLLMDQVRAEQANIEGQINALEKEVQDRIYNIRKEVQSRLGDDNTTNDELTQEEQDIIDGVVGFTWPVDSRIITCGFHCADYPFRRWFEHSGMDIAVPQGSNIYAAASGYVAIARFDGSSSYGYIMIVHGDGLASVYGHVSCVRVSVDQYVTRGQNIGCSGGMPGTPGAGSYSTGPHLHFEIRKDGIPVDPANYLP